jgi:tRNA(Leu) C34 or U34 (ribose-2'-O)-methylase TrmL
MKKIELLFDTIRSPYDIAHIIQIANAIDCEIYTAGNSISFDTPKVVNKVKSWNIKSTIRETHFATFAEAVKTLKSQNKYLVGTVASAKKTLYEIDLPENRDVVLVFGTETSGLTATKMAMLDDVVKLPMDSSKVDFLTLPVAVSASVYELWRRYHL